MTILRPGTTVEVHYDYIEGNPLGVIIGRQEPYYVVAVPRADSTRNDGCILLNDSEVRPV